MIQVAVTLVGFYDGVEETPDDIKQMWDGLGFSAAEFLGSIGLSMPSGEANRVGFGADLGATNRRSEWDHRWFILCEGFKTVIAAQASAKVSFRLVGTQDPHKVAAAFRQTCGRTPAGGLHCFLCEPWPQSGNPTDYNLPELKKAAAALTEEWGKSAAIIAGGWVNSHRWKLQKTIGHGFASHRDLLWPMTPFTHRMKNTN